MMKFDEFEKIVKMMEQEEQHTRDTKGVEYSNDDRLALFHELGNEVKCVHCNKPVGVLVVFWILFKKHTRAILSFINSGKIYSESIEARVMDCRVYLSLLRGLIEEQKKGGNCEREQKRVERKENKSNN